MTDQAKGVSPHAYARTGGLLYLYIIAAGLFAQVAVRGQLLVPGDATATAENIMASETLFRVGFAGEMLMLMCDVAVAFIFYVLLRPVSRNLALLAALFRLVMAAVSGANGLNHFAALTFLDGAEFLDVFEQSQLHALAYLSMKAHAYGYHISLIFFGFHCFFLGYLLFKATYFPKFLGLFMVVASFSYLINSFTSIISPEHAALISPMILLPALVAEASLALWLIVRGVNMKKWQVAVDQR